MRILVIGGNGFIGSPLVRELCGGGHHVGIFHREPAASESTSGITHIKGDRNRLSDYHADLARFAPEVIIDLILSSGQQAQQLMETADGIARRVVAVGSMDVYRAWGVVHGIEPGPLEPLPLTEASAVRTVRQLYPPQSLKAMQSRLGWLTDDYDKIAVEESIMNRSRLAGTILRLPMVYGPGDAFHRFFPLIKRIDDKHPFILLTEDFAAWRGPRGYVDNVAHAIALAATSEVAIGHIYNVCQEPSLSEFEWQTGIAQQAGWTGRFVTVPAERAPKHLQLPINTAQHVVATSQKIRTDLGFKELVGINAAIRHTIDWERQNPPATVDLRQFDYRAEDDVLASSQ